MMIGSLVHDLVSGSWDVDTRMTIRPLWTGREVWTKRQELYSSYPSLHKYRFCHSSWRQCLDSEQPWGQVFQSRNGRTRCVEDGLKSLYCRGPIFQIFNNPPVWKSRWDTKGKEEFRSRGSTYMVNSSSTASSSNEWDTVLSQIREVDFFPRILVPSNYNAWIIAV